MVAPIASPPPELLADETFLTFVAQSPDVPLSFKASMLLDTLFVRYGTTVASAGEWALLMAVIEGVRATA